MRMTTNKIRLFVFAMLLILVACADAGHYCTLGPGWDIAPGERALILFGDRAVDEVESIDELVLMSSDVIRVRVLDERVVCGHTPAYDVRTISQVEILEVYHGNLAVGDVVEIYQEGGRTDNLEVVNQYRMSLLRFQDDELVLFLQPFRQGVDLTLAMVPPVVFIDTADDELSSIRWWPELTLTQADLIEMAQPEDLPDE